MTLSLSRPDLLRETAFVGGQWIADDRTIAVTNPATGEAIGTVPSLGREEARMAIECAQGVMAGWAAQTAKDRARILRRWADLMLVHQEDLARIMTAEQGKRIGEARGEIAYAASFIEWFGEEAKRIYGDIIPGHQPDKRLLVVKQPIGVCAAITPWNFPAAMIARKAGPALAAGCGMVVKPASSTPFSALALCVLAEEAGVPPGLFSCVTGPAREIGNAFTENPAVRKLSFTGSTEIGRTLMAQCAQNITRISLELGGNAPFIVFDDADLDEAVVGVLTSKFRNAGQTCVCANRIYAQSGIHDRFVDRLKEAIGGLRVGDGLSPTTDIGPLIDAAAVAKVEEHVADAVSKGARVIVPGGRGSGSFFAPSLLADVPHDALVSREETFGPLAPVFRFDTEAEAIQLANDTPFGLAAYFYTRDYARVFRVTEALEYGIIGHNTGIISTEVAPFGGIKQSGFGREGSRYGIEDYLEIKYLCVGGVTAA